MDIVKEYVNIIVMDRANSWPIIAMVYALFALIARNVLVGSIVRRLQDLKRPYRRDIKKGYVKTALVGWVFYVVSIGCVIGLWYLPGAFPSTIEKNILFFVAIGSFFLYVILHLQAYALSSILTLKQVSEKEDIL